MPARLIVILACFCLIGCTDTRPPLTPPDPIPAGVALPPGMPNDKWFYEHVLQSEVPVLVDFNATWCGPCKAMKPALEEIKKAYGNRLKVVEIDVDFHTYVADHFEANRIPRLMVINNGVIEADAGGQRTFFEIVDLLKSTVGRP